MQLMLRRLWAIGCGLWARAHSRRTHSGLGSTYSLRPTAYGLIATLFLIPASQSISSVLPEDRADILFHEYDGGGVTVDGPSILVRKKFGDHISVTGNYYIDMVTSASIDVKVLGASEYKEKRTQWSTGVDYLRGSTTYSLSYINSEENDYFADTASFGISEDMFGDLTTVSVGFTRGWDQITKRNDSAFQRQLDRRSYRLGISQILTKKLVVGLNYETETNEGYLQNPYRADRYCKTPDCATDQIGFEEEVYPRTRSTNAIALDARYYLPWHASVHGNYRYFHDTWSIGAHTAEVGYIQPLKWHFLGGEWTAEGTYRYYTQTKADFYSDLFPYVESQNFRARDRNLSTFDSNTLHLGVTYQFSKVPLSFVQRATASVFWDGIQYNFKDFRDGTVQTQFAYDQPLYSYRANVYQIFLSLYF
jgi:Protein of unknown function (DUF3570)